MSNCIVLCGFSNSGKSTSMKYLDPEETFIVSCTNKQLQIPGFRSKYKKVEVVNGELTGNWLVSSDYTKIGKILNAVSKLRPDIKVLVIDDINYLLSAQTFADANTKGYEKFTILAKNYYDLISTCQNLRDDLTVVIISHIENAGTELDPDLRLWTTGKIYFASVFPNSVKPKSKIVNILDMAIPSQAEKNFLFILWRV